MNLELRLVISLAAGLLSGFILSIPPLGPTNIAVISKGFSGEVRQGAAIGSGAGFMDFFYVVIIYGGLSLIKLFIPDAVNAFFAEHEHFFITLITFAGCVIVVVYGIILMKRKPVNDDKPVKESIKELVEQEKDEMHKNIIQDTIYTKVAKNKSNHDIMKNFFVGVMLCLSSVTLPASWFIFVGYLKSYGVIDSYFLTGLVYAAGVWLGTSLWFYVLVVFIKKNLKKIKPDALNRLNVLVGIFLIGLGIFLLYKALDFSLHH